VCGYCRAPVTRQADRISRSDFVAALKRAKEWGKAGLLLPTIEIAGLAYALHHPIAAGHSGDVFFAVRRGRLTERVLVKILRAPADDDFMQHEFHLLTQLRQASVPGAHRFKQAIPTVLAGETINTPDGPRRAHVYRYQSGFAHSLADVAQAFPSGLKVQHGVWLLKRTFEILHFVHAAGLGHGAIFPEHVAVHARDHGVMLLGFSAAGPLDKTPLRAVDLRHRGLYPMPLFEEASPDIRHSKALDLVMAARVIRQLIDGAAGLPDKHRQLPFYQLLEKCSHIDTLPSDDAWELRDLVSAAAQESFGPPTFHSLVLQ
jgi:hypothetical protein